ncbi:hypothetical protein [Oceanobacillus halotolerans]|uniref:hypothetical protein n=1 Tax=Oceanobacillus halotolerans TaxID=2663380 RepID=UPI0013DC18EC|nr:hypothetical protein [Oceanobacillus halotolerans]
MEHGQICKACQGTGMLADDEGWQYKCRICNGDGLYNSADVRPSEILDVDETNRILD